VVFGLAEQNMNCKMGLKAVAGGIVITLATGVINATPNGLLGSAWYGLPFSWMRRLVISPMYNPWKANLVGLLGDIIVWTIVVAIVMMIVNRVKK
jgi:hypothetical protein